MGKGLLRKALHGAATSASGMLANRIEEKRQTRLMDYEAMRQRENQDYRYGQEKEMFGMGVEAQKAQDNTRFERETQMSDTAYQRQLDAEALRLENQRTLNAEEATRRQGESEIDFQRRMQELTFRSGLAREEELYKSGLTKDEKASEFQLRMDEIKEEARLKAEQEGIELTDIKFTVPDSMGNPTPVTMSARIDPQTGTVRLFDSGTGQFVSAREMADIDDNFETLAKAEQWLPQVLENDKDLDGFQESLQSWREAMGDTPIPEVYTRQLPQEFQDYLRSEPAPTSARGAQSRQPAADPLAPFEGRAVQPGLVSRATAAISNAASTVGMAQVTSGGETESVKQNAKWLLENHLSRGTLPERTLMSRPRIESALRSDLLSDEDKTMLRRYLEQD